jgi:hypothetical protein
VDAGHDRLHLKLYHHQRAYAHHSGLSLAGQPMICRRKSARRMAYRQTFGFRDQDARHSLAMPTRRAAGVA